MSERNITLAFMVEGWEAYHNALSKALAPLSPEQLALRPAPNLRSVDELACHIIAARAGWYHDVLREGDDTLDAFSHWDEPGNLVRSAGELVEGLVATWRVMQDALARFTPTDLQAVLETEWQGKMYTHRRGWVVWHVIEHDLHHGGEIGYSLGMHGIEAPDI